MNYKGFLFTISIVLFATTLVFYSQVYSEGILKRESQVLDAYRLDVVSYLGDDIKDDLFDILNFDFEKEFKEEKVYITVSNKFPLSNISTRLSDYEDFLQNDYFDNYKGNNNIDLTNIEDGTFEVNNSVNNVIIDYENNKLYFNNDFNGIDMNIFVIGDLNYYDSNFISGSTPVNINYFDDNNVIIFNETMDTSVNSYIKLIYADNNVLINIGLNNNKYFEIDSNTNNELSYDLRIENYFDNNYFEEYINSKLIYQYELINSNSFISIN
jgi:hypothetical protein